MSGEYDASRRGGTGASSDTESQNGRKSWDDGDGSGADESGGTLRWALESGALALLGGAFLVFRGLTGVVRGKRLRGVVAALAGAALIALGRSQWRERRIAPLAKSEGWAGADDRAADEERHGGAASQVETDAGAASMAEDEPQGADPAEADATETGAAADRGEGDHAEADDNGADRPEAAAEPRGRPPVDDAAEPAPVGEDVDVLGAAAFDAHGLEVPVPQRAFDLGYLSPGEVFWGVRLADGAVVVSDLFDPIWDDEDYHYVGSSEVAEDRTLRVPDDVLDNWDRVYQGGDAVVGGDDLTFLTTPELTEHDQLRVVPEAWLESVLGEESGD